MNNTYEFNYRVHANLEDDEESLFPERTMITAEHQFQMGHTWEQVLWQFCRFLESTGFEGVREKVLIRDDHHRCGYLFQDYFDRPVELNEDGKLQFTDEDYLSYGDKD
jgi:hypothetical protein